MSEASWEKIRKLEVKKIHGISGQQPYTVEDFLTGEGGREPDYNRDRKALKIDYYDSHMHGGDEDFVLNVLVSVASKMSSLQATVEGTDVPFMIFIWRGGYYVKDYEKPRKPSLKEKVIGERRFRKERSSLPDELKT
jgi:hypothetical protein